MEQNPLFRYRELINEQARLEHERHKVQNQLDDLLNEQIQAQLNLANRLPPTPA